jgi:uncharacterized membrane protein YciS (DUF1049 family)
MVFRFYTNAISQASKRLAAGIFTTGLALIGFGFMIYLLPRLFATLAAVIFFAAGLGCAITAVKIFWLQRKFDKFNSNDSQVYRQNVHIHIKEDFDS